MPIPGFIQYAGNDADTALNADLLRQLIGDADLIAAPPAKGMTKMEQPPLVCTEETALRGCNTLIDVERYRRIDLSIEIVDSLNRCIDTVRLVPLQGNIWFMLKCVWFGLNEDISSSASPHSMRCDPGVRA